MKFTIEHEIFDLICERLKQHLVCGAMIEIPESKPISHYSKIEISGTQNILYPRTFEVSITGENKCTISEKTLFADLGTSAPIPYFQEIDYVAETPFEIDSTGIYLLIKSSAEIEDEWLIRIGNAYSSVVVYPHPFDYSGLPAPSLGVYATGNSSSPLVLEKQESVMDLDIVLTLSKEQVENGDHLEILGDIRDCINRDQKLWNGTSCLSENLIYMSDVYLEQTDRGNSIFVCSAQITYRSQLKNARLK